MEDFINVIKKDPKVRVKINDMLDRYNRLSYNYQSEIGYDTLVQKIIPKEILNLMGITIVDIDIELKMKISRIKYLKSKKSITFRLSKIDSNRSRKVLSIPNMLNDNQYEKN